MAGNAGSPGTAGHSRRSFRCSVRDREEAPLSVSRSGAFLLERERELAQLDAALEQAVAGTGRLVVVEGPAGIGKTKLLSEGCARGRARGMRVLVARCAELEREFSFGAARQLFERLVATAEADGPVLSGPAGLAVSILDPSLAPTRPFPEDNRFAALNALFWLTVNLTAEGPVLLALDDLQSCDESSLRFVEFLARRIEGLGVVVLVSMRIGPSSLGRVVAALLGGPSVLVLRPDDLSVDASTEVIRAAFSAEPDAGFADACQVATGGNPLLLTELVRMLAADGVAPTAEGADRVLAIGPGALSHTVERRLAGLSGDAVRLARAAAVLGDGGAAGDAAALAGLDRERADTAHVALTRVRILRPGERIEFVHPLVRAAVYAELGTGGQERAHRDAARLLALSGALPEQVAAHLLLVRPGNDPDVVTTLEDAARRAATGGDPSAAVAYLARALAEPPAPTGRARLLGLLGATETLVEAPAAIDHLEEACRLETGARRRAELAVLLGRTLFFRGRFAEATAASRAALDSGGCPDDLRELLEAIQLHGSCYSAATTEIADRLADRVRRSAPSDTAGSKALHAVLAYRDARAGMADAAGRAEQALHGGRLITEDNGGGPAYCAVLVLIAADSPRALETCDAGFVEAGRRGSVFAYASNKVLRGRALLCRGALAEAAAEIEDGITAAERWGLTFAPVNTAYLADVQMEQGQLDAATGTIEGIERGDLHGAFGPWLLERRARLDLLAGRPDTALSAAMAAGAHFARIGGRNPAFVPWRSQAALARHALGDAVEAGVLAAQEVELARAWGAPRTLGRALRVAGLVAGGDRGRALLREAVAVLDGSIARLELARAQVDLGAALRRANRRADARAPLRAGLDIAEVCGARPLAERARDELRAAGGRPRSHTATGIGALTPSERRIAVLAARGRSNAEIAQTLFVTPKTVEMHLSNAYRKLGVGSRHDLPTSLDGPG